MAYAIRLEAVGVILEGALGRATLPYKLTGDFGEEENVALMDGLRAGLSKFMVRMLATYLRELGSNPEIDPGLQPGEIMEYLVRRDREEGSGIFEERRTRS
jgi:hypothetical protein